MFFNEKLVNEYSFNLLSCKSFYYKFKDISDKNGEKIFTNKRKIELGEILKKIEEELFNKFKNYENFNGNKEQIEYVNFNKGRDSFNKIERILNKDNSLHESIEQLFEYKKYKHKNIENLSLNSINEEKYLFLRLHDKVIRIIFYYDEEKYTLYPLLIDLNHCIIGNSFLSESNIKKLKEWNFEDRINNIKREIFKKCQKDKRRDIAFKNPYY